MAQLENAENDNIQVAIRVRPLSTKEKNEGVQTCVQVIPSGNGQAPVIKVECKPSEKVFSFDHIYASDASQTQIFDTLGKRLCDVCIEGYNACVFVYGQTGAGKTYTMTGDAGEQRGLLPRVLEHLFGRMSSTEAQESSKALNRQVEHLIQCQYFEIYNEVVMDLLASANSGDDEAVTVQKRCGLQVRESMLKGVYIENITEELCSTAASALALIERGQKIRHVAGTLMNTESSRSHSVFTLVIESKSVQQQDDVQNQVQHVKISKLHFVDLAGSERQQKTGAQSERLREASNINKSLTVLGLVINCLVEQVQQERAAGKSSTNSGKGVAVKRHIPYRDSKLTFILKDSLGGNSRTFMIAAVSEASQQILDTLSTLKFAERAKKIKCCALVNEETSGSVNALKSEIARMRAEIAALRANKDHLPSKEIVPIFSVLENTREKMDVESAIECRPQRDSLKELFETQNFSTELSISSLQEQIYKYFKLISTAYTQQGQNRAKQAEQLAKEVEDRLAKINNENIPRNDLSILSVYPSNTTQQMDIQRLLRINKEQEDMIERQKQQIRILQDKATVGKQQVKVLIEPSHRDQSFKTAEDTELLHSQDMSYEIKKHDQLLQNIHHKGQQDLMNQQIKDLEICLKSEQQKNEEILKHLQALEGKMERDVQTYKDRLQSDQERIQQLQDKLKEEQCKNSTLTSQNTQLKDDCDTLLVTKEHWHKEYNEENTRHYFYYKLAQKHEQTIKELNEQNEQLQSTTNYKRKSSVTKQPSQYGETPRKQQKRSVSKQSVQKSKKGEEIQFTEFSNNRQND